MYISACLQRVEFSFCGLGIGTSSFATSCQETIKTGMFHGQFMMQVFGNFCFITSSRQVYHLEFFPDIGPLNVFKVMVNCLMFDVECLHYPFILDPVSLSLLLSVEFFEVFSTCV